MGPEGNPLERFGDRWARATDEELPPIDAARGRELLLAANERLLLERARRSRRTWALISAAALACAFAIGFFTRSRAAYTFTVDAESAPVGASVETNGAAPRQILFSEGSTMKIAPASVLQVREVDRKGATLLLDRGGVEVDIVARPDSRWELHAGPFQVRVLGTAFRVEWAPELQHFVLTVHRGSVFVRGPMLEPGRDVQAGARCEVELPKGRLVVGPVGDLRASDTKEAAPPESREQASAVDPPMPREPSSAEVRSKKGAAAAPGDARRAPSWQELERTGQFDKALREAERVGLDAIYDTASAEDLLSLARAARFVGRSNVSAGALLACRRRFPSTREAAAAAYLMGRNAAPDQAVKWFSAYLSEEPGGAWAREASGRLVEAHQANGDVRSAREAAKRYLARYPDGPHADFAKRVLEN
jgi:hypothetical protein